MVVFRFCFLAFDTFNASLTGRKTGSKPKSSSCKLVLTYFSFALNKSDSQEKEGLCLCFHSGVFFPSRPVETCIDQSDTSSRRPGGAAALMDVRERCCVLSESSGAAGTLQR